MEFSKQEYWSGLPFPPPEDLSDPGIEPVSPAVPASEGDMGLIPRSGRFSGKGNGNTLQYSCLGNALNRGAWQTTVHGVAKSQT